jgi:protein involved in polysaccharide export with SLBB domain
MKWRTAFLFSGIMLMMLNWKAAAQSGPINSIGGFESPLPSYWTIGNQPSGSTVSWATDQYRSLGHSLKITKSATSDSAAWVSENMCDIWSPQHLKNVDILLGAYVKTQGVNTSPTSDDQKWYVAYTFWDSAGALIGQVKLPVNQATATSSGWVADTNGIGTAILPKDAWKTIISFVGGKNATGTVWADDFIFTGRGGAWAGQDWNTGVGVPTGWYYWLPPNGGNDGLLSNGFENTVITSDAAHSGSYSLKFVLPADRQPHDAFVGTRRFLLNGTGTTSTTSASVTEQLKQGIAQMLDAKPGDVLRISVWVKASNLVPDSEAAYPTTWSVGITPGFFSSNGNNDGYNPIYQPDLMFTFPNATSFDWTQYHVDVTVPSDPTVKALEVRLHVYARFTGTVYFDDLTVEKLDAPDLNAIGGFESPLPSYWTIGNQPSGSTVSWATDQYRSLGHSLKITKSATSDSAAWVSENMCDIWSPQHLKNVDILLGAYVKTQGVNTSPTSDDQKWYVAYTFWDSAGALIGQVKLPVNQATATSSGWVADTNGIGTAILPKDAWKTIISFVGGKNATGTVWADDFIFTGRGGAWAGQDWNTGVGVPTGWYYWLPPNGGNDGLLSNGFENTVITSDAAHSGSYSLKFVLPADRQPHDAFVGTRRFLLNGTGTTSTTSASVTEQLKQGIAQMLDAKPGDVLRISVWVKASNLVPDSEAAYPTTWSVGITPGFFSSNGNNDGYNPIYQPDLMFTFPNATSFDWTQYSADITVPTDPTTKTLEVRLHVYARFTGTVYFDDLTVEKVGETSNVPQVNNGLPVTYELGNNYPNPFNPSTMIDYGVPRDGNISLEVYNILGQRVRTLFSGYRAAGRYSIAWDGRNENGETVNSGVYFFRMSTGSSMALVRKMLLLK